MFVPYDTNCYGLHMGFHQPPPTARQYGELQRAYDFFNEQLFENRLPNVLITMARKRGAGGYFWGDKFLDLHGNGAVSEVALSPADLRRDSLAWNLSVLAHEMTHVEQHAFGRPSRGGYHNAAWGDLMERIGLIPTATGQPGGKRTGQKVSHYPVEGGPFDLACRQLIATGFTIPYGDRQDEKAPKPPATDKVRFMCDDCGAKAWGSICTVIECVRCQRMMYPPKSMMMDWIGAIGLTRDLLDAERNGMRIDDLIVPLPHP